MEEHACFVEDQKREELLSLYPIINGIGDNLNGM